MKKSIPFFLFAVLIISASCSRKHYTSSFFDQQTAGHKIIAVLPSEIVLTGKKPEQLTEEQIAKIEEEESQAFQLSLYGNILRHANSRKYYMSVGVQDVNKTMATLEESKISLRDSWKMDDKKLAQLLGVDAIVRIDERDVLNRIVVPLQTERPRIRNDVGDDLFRVVNGQAANA